MPCSKEHKAEVRVRILEQASQTFRKRGLDGVSVPELMGQVGLTHGGFYAHFDSKEALYSEAFLRALEESLGRLETTSL
ncbi:MAG: TetR family transcriptional regulator, partial [Meiothermus sp.]